jgi:hypothetical protein
MAHELGHGAFRLKHVFESDCKYKQGQGQTNNLMDYVEPDKATTALLLHKYQWDQERDWNLGINWFEDGSEGEMLCLGIFDDCDAVLTVLGNIRTCNIKGFTLKVKRPKDKEDQLIEGKSLDIEKVNYAKIAILFSGEIGKEYNMTTKNYRIHDYNLTGSGYYGKQKSIQFSEKESPFDPVFEVILYANDEKELNDKIKKLESYLKMVGNSSTDQASIDDFTYASGRQYGWLSAGQESGKDGGCALGYDSKGGCSYGKHQIAAKTGSLKKFVDWANEKTSNKYNYFTDEWIDASIEASSKKKCEECDFTKKWMELCNDDEFNTLQHNFILEKNYKPVYDKITDNFGSTALFKDLSGKDEEALKEMCVSLGVQHGGAYRIFQMALLKDYTGCSDTEILDKKDKDCSAKSSDFPAKDNDNQTQISDMKKTANDISMSDFIDRVYAARKMYVKAYDIEGWKNMVKYRYKDEPSTLKLTLGF